MKAFRARRLYSGVAMTTHQPAPPPQTSLNVIVNHHESAVDHLA